MGMASSRDVPIARRSCEITSAQRVRGAPLGLLQPAWRGSKLSSSFVGCPGGMRRTWPSHRILRIAARREAGGWLVRVLRASLEMISGQRIPSMRLSARLSNPSIRAARVLFSGHDSDPYSRMDITEALYTRILVRLDTCLCLQSGRDRLCITELARALRRLSSGLRFPVRETTEPRYLKVSTNFTSIPSNTNGGGFGPSPTSMISVLSQFMVRPSFRASSSNTESAVWISSRLPWIKTASSAYSRSLSGSLP